MKHTIARRTFLLKSALSFGSLPMQSLVTGLPVSFLAGTGLAGLSNRAFAADDYKYLIISHMRTGDPINANMPGTYPANNSDVLSNIDHPDAPGFKVPTDFKLGTVDVKAAAPWAKLPNDLRARMGFWNHGTYVNAHTDFQAVRRFNGAVKDEKFSLNSKEEFDGFISQETANGLGCVLKEPLSVGGNRINYDGQSVPIFEPDAIKGLFASNAGNIERMIKARDHFVDRNYRSIKNNGTPAQKKFFDRMVQSRQTAATVSEELSSRVSGINGDDPTNQAKMIVALIQVNVAPVYTFGIPFGGDNHQDNDLSDEVQETTKAMEYIETLWKELKSAGKQNDVVVTSLNPFGRTLLRNSRGGRDHNGLHHGMFVFGQDIKPGIVGGLEPVRTGGKVTEFKASAIQSNTGKARANGDIPFEETLVSVGKTLAKAVGISDARIEKRLDGGKIIKGALNS